MGEANGAHKPHDDEPDQAAAGNDGAPHGGIICPRVVSEDAHAQMRAEKSGWDVLVEARESAEFGVQACASGKYHSRFHIVHRVHVMSCHVTS